jgi:hypothetical protein
MTQRSRVRIPPGRISGITNGYRVTEGRHPPLP